MGEGAGMKSVMIAENATDTLVVSHKTSWRQKDSVCVRMMVGGWEQVVAAPRRSGLTESG